MFDHANTEQTHALRQIEQGAPRMAAQLTDQDRALIRSLSHLPLRDIARRVGRSTSTVAAVLAKPAPTAETVPTPIPTPDAPADDAPILDQLSRTIRSLEAAAAAARADGDVARLVSAERAATQAIALLARLTPPEPSDAGMMLVPAGEMHALAAKASTLLERELEAALAEADTWPKCPTCGQPIAPKEAT